LHAGDVFQGDLFWNDFFGVPEFVLMEQLGFDAMAVGNHEFDAGPDPLYESLAYATSLAGGSVPLLSANLDFSACGDDLECSGLQSFVTPSVVKTYGDVKVGIFGLTVPDDLSASPAPVAIESDYVEIAQSRVDALRAGGADVVVLLSHLGFLRDREVAAEVKGIDFIIGGHDHYLFEKPVVVTHTGERPTLVFQAGSHYLDMGKLTFTVTQGVVHVDQYEMIPLDATVTPDPDIQNFIDGLKADIFSDYDDQDFYGTRVGTAATDLEYLRPPKAAARDSALGNLITDAYREKTGTPIGLTADGWISEKIWAGPIVGADVFHAVSYGYDPSTGLGFHLVTLDLTAEQLVTVLEITLSQLGVNDDFFLQTSGMTFQYDSRRDPGERVLLESIRVGGEAIDFSGTYSVTVNEGSAALLGYLGIDATNVSLTPYIEYDALRDYIQDLDTVSYASEGRIQDVALHHKK
jgi:2',3'-cyclic-nucleotide 2'-phosphodiesterase (5'-nucleotidase family)